MHSLEEDNELDNVARKAAVAFDAPGLANWNKMLVMLDYEMPQEKQKKRFIWWIFPAILFGGTAIYLFTLPQPETNNTKNTISTEKKPEIISNQKSNQQSNQDSNLNKEGTLNKEPNNISPTVAKNDPLSPNNSNNIKTKTSKIKTIATNNTNLSNAVSSIETPTQKTNETVLKTELATTDTISTSTSISTATEISTVTATNSTVESINPVAEISRKKVSQNNQKGFFIGLTAGVDISTVKYNYQNGMGYNFGAQLGYRFNKHWSIQTGAIYTKKNYKLNGSDFHPPKGSWISNYTLETVSGACYMWDIPLLATYHFNGSNKRNTFLSIGSSSYIMKKEDYNYYYIVNNQPYYRSAQYESNEQYLFSIIHISAGIEKTIGKNLKGIIEPYAKLPLAGVGYGSIELSSFGINLSLQYKQPKKK